MYILTLHTVDCFHGGLGSTMEILRKFFWLWVISGSVFFSVVIALIFVLINKCISKKAAEHYNRNTPNHTTPQFYAQCSQYHPKDLVEDLPPLPSRVQFLTSCPDKSYENLAELPDYVKVDEKALPPPYHETETLACQEVCHDRDNISADYEECNNVDNISADYEECNNVDNISADYDECHDVDNISADYDECHDVDKISEDFDQCCDSDIISKDYEECCDHDNISEDYDDIEVEEDYDDVG